MHHLRLAFFCCVLSACTDPVVADSGTDAPISETSADSGGVDAAPDAPALDVPTAEASIDAPIDVADAGGDDVQATDVVSELPAVDVGMCDEDGDGHLSIACGGDDCADNKPEVHPGAPELCDGRDQNCDGIEDVMPGGGFDPAADMTCETGHPLGGTVVTATHCYVMGSTPPCSTPDPKAGFGACYGCYQPPGGSAATCDFWCTSGLTCSGMCTPTTL